MRHAETFVCFIVVGEAGQRYAHELDGPDIGDVLPFRREWRN